MGSSPPLQDKLHRFECTPCGKRGFSSGGADDDPDLDDALKRRVESVGGGQVMKDALSKLGVQSVDHLKYVSSEDLTSLGVKLVQAKMLLDQPSSAASAPSASTSSYDPEAAMWSMANTGASSADRSTSQILTSSFLGGAFLGFGGALTLTVAGGSATMLASAPGMISLIGGAVFPVGLSMIVLTKSELMTGNFGTCTLPFWTHPQVSQEQHLVNAMRVFSLSGLGNLAGSVFLATGTVAMGLFASTSPAGAFAAALAVKKCALAPGVAFLKGAACNWLVNVAIFQAATTQSTAGKIASLWLPIMTFVTLGMEHSVANMFLLPVGMLAGADVGVLDMLGNLVPVAAGNAFGAAAFVAGLQRFNILAKSGQSLMLPDRSDSSKQLK